MANTEVGSGHICHSFLKRVTVTPRLVLSGAQLPPGVTASVAATAVVVIGKQAFDTLCKPLGVGFSGIEDFGSASTRYEKRTRRLCYCRAFHEPMLRIGLIAWVLASPGGVKAAAALWPLLTTWPTTPILVKRGTKNGNRDRCA